MEFFNKYLLSFLSIHFFLLTTFLFEVENLFKTSFLKTLS